MILIFFKDINQSKWKTKVYAREQQENFLRNKGWIHNKSDTKEYICAWKDIMEENYHGLLAHQKW